MSGPRIFKDAVTGKHYEVLDLPMEQAQLCAPILVCECTRCRTRFMPADLARGCPKCCEAAPPPSHHQPGHDAIPAVEERVVLVPPSGSSHT